MTPPPLKIAVLAGGPSCEREISLLSGGAVLDALVSKGHSAQLLDPLGDFIPELRALGASFVFIALHGLFGEDGTVQRLLEKEGIPYTGSGPAASEIAFDKARAQSLFRRRGIRAPDFQIFKRNERAPAERLAVPCVVKPAMAGSSVGISLVFEESHAQQALDEAFRYSDTVLVERYVSGRELTVGILGDEVLPIVEVIPKRTFYDYEAKYGDSGTRYEAPARLEEETASEVRQAALEAYRALGCEVFARADVMLSKEDGKPYMLEVNTIPGLTGKSLLPKAAKASGVDFPGLCVRILELSMSRIENGQAFKIQN